MSRRISSDFRELKSFFTNYNLKNVLTNNAQAKNCKAMHKKLYGLMIFAAEYNIQIGAENMSVYLNEMTSDLLLSLFNWIQGMYKPSKLELRCAIENFLKALLSVDESQIIMETRMHVIFDSAKEDRHFNNSYSTPVLGYFRSVYSDLCRVVHSSLQDIDSMSAMNLLPKFDGRLAEDVARLYRNVVEKSTGVLYAQYPIVIDQMHPENKKDFFDCLQKSTKKNVISYLFD